MDPVTAAARDAYAARGHAEAARDDEDERRHWRREDHAPDPYAAADAEYHRRQDDHLTERD